MEPVELTGRWWLPESPANRVVGTFKFSPDVGGTLDLVGGLGDIVSPSVLLAAPLIVGESVNGDGITLVECSETHRKGWHPGIDREPTEQSWRSQFCLIGGRFDTAEAMVFHEVTVSMTSLDQWADLGFLVKFDRFEEEEEEIAGPAIASQVTHYKFHRPLPTKITELPGIGSLGINHAETNRDNPGYIEHQITPYISALVEEPIDIATLLDRIVQPLHYFLCLMINVPTDIVDIRLYSPNSSRVMPSNGVVVHDSIRLLYQRRGPGANEPISYFQIPFTFGKHRERMGAVLVRWFEQYERYREPLDLLFDLLLSSAPMTLETRYLVAAQAAEVYHRFTRTESGPSEAHRQRVERIVGATPTEEDKKWLSGKLQYSHEPSLRRRFIELAKLAGDEFREFPWNRKSFPSKAADTRNYVTHWDPTSKSRAAHMEELYWLTETVLMLVKVILLCELGFERHEIAAGLATVPRGKSLLARP